MLKSTLPSVHNLCTKKCKSLVHGQAWGSGHTSVRITWGLSTWSRRVQMPAHPLDPTCIPSTTNISSPSWNLSRQAPGQEISYTRDIFSCCKRCRHVSLTAGPKAHRVDPSHVFSKYQQGTFGQHWTTGMVSVKEWATSLCNRYPQNRLLWMGKLADRYSVS